ncbi:4341_t:CDS:2 [Diversispora eburnea]|uniref:4341_t:CDS:1 n=1 Tax=Diversispora eburnea TaxID=1213867 RepID=A0A9N9F6Q2_9GLOM|nr:4341_t:CDS:2 [Diversispora eburnea]
MSRIPVLPSRTITIQGTSHQTPQRNCPYVIAGYVMINTRSAVTTAFPEPPSSHPPSNTVTIYQDPDEPDKLQSFLDRWN